MRQVNTLKVCDMEFIEGNATRKILERNQAILSGGGVNYYRVMFMKGQGGSRKEETWNKAEHHHDCCRSRVPWRHKTECPRLSEEFNVAE